MFSGVNHNFPMVVLWFSCGFPMVFRWTSPIPRKAGRVFLQVQKDAFEEWFRPTLMEAGYEGIFQPPPRRPVVGWYPKKKLTGAFYVGNRWVAGSCWDEKNDS